MAGPKATIIVPESEIAYLQTIKDKVDRNGFFAGNGITCEIKGNVLSIFGPLSHNHYHSFLNRNLHNKPKGFSAEYHPDDTSRQGVGMDIIRELEETRKANERLRTEAANFDIDKGELTGRILGLEGDLRGMEAIVQESYTKDATIIDLRKQLGAANQQSEEWYFRKLPEDLGDAVLQSVYKFSIREDLPAETYGRLESLIGRLVQLGFKVQREEIEEVLKLARIHIRAPDAAERLERIFRVRNQQLAERYSTALVEIHRIEDNIKLLGGRGLAEAAKLALTKQLDAHRAVTKAYQEGKTRFTTDVRETLGQIEDLLQGVPVLPVYVLVTEHPDNYTVEAYLPVQFGTETKRTDLLTEKAIFGRSAYGTIRRLVTKKSGTLDLLTYEAVLPKKEFGIADVDLITRSMREAARELYGSALMQLGAGIRFEFGERLQFRLDYKGAAPPPPPDIVTKPPKPEENSGSKKMHRSDAEANELRGIVINFVISEYAKTGKRVPRGPIMDHLKSLGIEITPGNLTNYLVTIVKEDNPRLAVEGTRGGAGYIPG